MRQIATISRKKTAVKQFFFCSVLQVKVGVQVLLIQSGLGLTWDGLAARGGLHLSHLGSSEQQQVHVRLMLLQILASLWNGKHLENPSLLFSFATFHWHIYPSKLIVSNFISTTERIIVSRTFGSRSHMFLQLQHEHGGMRAAGWFRNWAAFCPVTLHKLLFEKRTESGWFLAGRQTNFQHLAGSWQ